MKYAGRFKAGLLVALYVATSLLAGCVAGGPREGYYDAPHHRWWHNHAWVACTPGDVHCR